MINILFKTLLYNLSIDYGYTNVIIEHKELFRKLYYNTFEELIISEVGSEIPSSKISVINNLLDIDINEKKNITDLYKHLNKRLSTKLIDDTNMFIGALKNYIDSIQNDFNETLDYELELDFNKLFQSINLRYYIDNNFIIDLILYLKHIGSYKIIITFNLNNYLTDQEIDIISNELKINQIILLNISSNTNFKNTTLTIDKDLCII